MSAIKQYIKKILKRLLRLNPVKVPASPGEEHNVIPNRVLFPIIIEELNNGHTATIVLKGNSMRPFLCHMRDKALLTLPGDFKVGDPVLAENFPGHYVLHRVVDIQGETVTLRGDGNIATETCRRSDVKALAVAFYRKGRQKPDLITSRKWRIYSYVWMHTLPIRVHLLRLHQIFFQSLKVLD